MQSDRLGRSSLLRGGVFGALGLPSGFGGHGCDSAEQIDQDLWGRQSVHGLGPVRGRCQGSREELRTPEAYSPLGSVTNLDRVDVVSIVNTVRAFHGGANGLEHL